MEIPPDAAADEPEEDTLAFAEALLKRQDGEETPVECGSCNNSFPFRTCRLLLAEDYGETPASGERYIFLCEDCWWEVIGNPRQEELQSVVTQEGLEDVGNLDAYSLVAEVIRRDEAAEA